MASFLGEMMLYGNSTRQALSFLPRLSRHPADFASTDLRPFLEYQTPKGNTLSYDTTSLNRQFLQRLRPLPLPLELLIRNLPSENERNLILGYASEGRGDVRTAVEYYERVDGPARSRARAQIARIQHEADPQVWPIRH